MDDKPVVCFLQPNFIEEVKKQESPCFQVSVFDDASVFHIRVHSATHNGEANGYSSEIDNTETKVLLKIFADEESLDDKEKVKSAVSECFGEEKSSKSELLLMIGKISNAQKENENSIKVSKLSRVVTKIFTIFLSFYKNHFTTEPP